MLPYNHTTNVVVYGVGQGIHSYQVAPSTASGHTYGWAPSDQIPQYAAASNYGIISP